MRPRSRVNISKYAPMWCASVTGCAFCRCVKPGIQVSRFASMMFSRTSCSSRSSASTSPISPRTYMRMSRATWSFRLRPVCSFRPGSPIRSVSVLSMKLWMSSWLMSIFRVPSARSFAMEASPEMMASQSSAGRIPCFFIIAACAMLPRMSSAASRRS